MLNYVNSLNDSTKKELAKNLNSKFNLELNEYEKICDYVFNKIQNFSFETFEFILYTISSYLNLAEGVLLDNDIGMLTVEDRKEFRMNELNKMLERYNKN
jgi:hypothetical protein